MKLILIVGCILFSQLCVAQDAITIIYYRYPSTDFSKKRYKENDEFGLRAAMVFNDTLCYTRLCDIDEVEHIKNVKVVNDSMINHSNLFIIATKECFDIVNNKPNKLWILKDSTSESDWELTNDHKVILGYNCSLVEKKYKGRKIIVWFTNDLKFKKAPFVYPGVPGVVLEVYDQRTGVHYKPISITETKTVIATPKNAMIVSEKEFRDLRKKQIRTSGN